MIDTDYIGRLGRLAFAAAVISFAGCTDDEGIIDIGVRPSDCLAFTASVRSDETSSASRGSAANLEIEVEEWTLQTTSENSTRGNLTTLLGSAGEAGVIGYIYDSGDPTKTPLVPSTPAEPDKKNIIPFTFEGDELHTTDKDKPIRWNAITKANLDIYAYAPMTMDGLEANTDLEVDTDDAPSFTYELPGTVDVADQKDIIVSKWKSPDGGNYRNKTIHLTFDHALTAIRFKVGFACTVKSVSIQGVQRRGTYSFSKDAWDTMNDPAVPDTPTDPDAPVSPAVPTADYKIDFGDSGKSFGKGDKLTDGENTLILLPQTLPDDAKIVLTCTDKTYTASIGGKRWEQGKVITYTLYEDKAPETIYFDLALADVLINGSTYSGKVDKGAGAVEVTGTHKAGNRYYVYQSAENHPAIWSGDVCTPPVYDEVKGPDGRPWRDYITNNTDVDAVIDAWCKGSDTGNDNLAQAAGRRGTKYRIAIDGDVTCELTIDNIYSTHQQSGNPDWRETAGIAFRPLQNSTNVNNAEVTIKMIGDNRVGAVHYANYKLNNNKIIFEGPGSLTAADVDGVKFRNGDSGLETGNGYWNNHWSSAIGNHDSSPGTDAAYGIVINSGIIFAGTTKAENCTAIGGGGNAYGTVTINGGTVTAVATTTGTAIGGGIGFSSPGGVGDVTITGGNVYAYNHANRWGIPSSAIGGAGSRANYGEKGIVRISGGYVYAESELGTAIGGGSSYSKRGGDAEITITGGEVIAKTKAAGSASIGGGTAFTNKFGEYNPDADSFNGGYATVTIEGNPIIRTGSIGGGGTGDTEGKNPGHLGNATIHVSGGDISAQFILAAGTGAGQIPSFTMTGGTIRNSDTADEEYLHTAENGGAVYLERGTVTISSGTIRNCSAEEGGAIYIKGKENEPSSASFTMTGGTIQDNEVALNGGAIYIVDGTVELSGGTIDDNLATIGNGGGVFIQRGILTVNGATIKNNSAEASYMDGGNGGGIYVYSVLQDVKVDLISGSIIGNTADRRGGGVCVDMQNSKQVADVIIGTENGGDDGIKITENHALVQGGGLFARGANAHITINSGTIMNNTVSQYVYNQNVANELGTVTLNGGNVTYNKVLFYANDGKDNEPVIQNIVTSTNSKLIAPEFHRTGYKLVGWNTKQNGKGNSYTDGQTMNINTDITLYAQWEIAVTQ